MKITKTQLKQIIKEELEAVQTEAYRDTVDNREIAKGLPAMADSVRIAHQRDNREEATNLINQMIELFAAGSDAELKIGMPTSNAYSIKQISGTPGLLNILVQELSDNPDLEGKFQDVNMFGSTVYVYEQNL